MQGCVSCSGVCCAVVCAVQQCVPCSGVCRVVCTVQGCVFVDVLYSPMYVSCLLGLFSLASGALGRGLRR